MWCVWCDTLKTPVCPSTTSLCVRSKRPRVCRDHAHTCFDMCAWCRYTRGRFERTHGDVLNGHTRRRRQRHTTTHNNTTPHNTTQPTQHNQPTQHILPTQHNRHNTAQHNTPPHTTHNTQHTRHNTTHNNKNCPHRVITCFRGSPKLALDLTHFQIIRFA